jgi:hypothetical protein
MLCLGYVETQTTRFGIMSFPFTFDDTPGWREIDASLLDDRRGAVPAFPVDLLPLPWRDWVADTARAAGAPIDYAAQALLAAVAGLCGAGAAVRITDAWSEPLVLWQALVGGPSSGKSPALAPVRRLLAALEAEGTAGGDADSAKAEIVVADTAVAKLAAIVAANPRGVILWRDRPSDWLADIGGDDWLEAWAAAHLPISILGSIAPDRLADALAERDGGLAARFLYAWPGLPSFCPLVDRGDKPGDEEALNRLRRIARKARTPDDPLVLQFDSHGIKAFNEFLAGLSDERRAAEGLEEGWLGKGAGTVARLAGVLELLAWSGLAAVGPPGHLGRDQVDAAIRLWCDYFRPHARAVLDHAQPSTQDVRARRVARWLKARLREDGARTDVSREEVRREALGKSVNAEQAEQVLHRLTTLGVVRAAPVVSGPRGGRPARRWQVNPELAAG